MKAILEFDAPESCDECLLCELSVGNGKYYCKGIKTYWRDIVDDETVDGYGKIICNAKSITYKEQRAPFCPLKIVEDAQSEADTKGDDNDG